MNQIIDNDVEEELNQNQFLPLFFKEFSIETFQQNYWENSLNQIKDNNNNELFIEKIKNIFHEETLGLNESDDEDNNKSLYFIKKKDNLETESPSTENSTNNFILEQDKYNSNKKETRKKINFQTFLKKKRGKKPKFENLNFPKKYHGSEDFDNIQRKIQVHFISFLISLANDKVAQIFGKKININLKILNMI